MKTLSLSQVFLLFVTILLASCAPKMPELTATPPPIVDVASFPSKIRIGEIDVEFSGYKQDKDYFTISICFAPPSTGRWMFDEVVFKVDNQEIQPTWLSFDDKPGRPDGFSCGTLLFSPDVIPNIGKAELSIGQLQTDVDAKEYDCDKAQRKLNETNTGIVVTCDLGAFGQDSGFGIVKKPQSMSNEEAHDLVMDAFADTIQVNWRFSFHIQKP